ncbi:MAG: ATP-binding cassette domain-containing protein [Aminobacterium sp.]|jgi:cell division transport system ATP-binding protein|uniref:cell division ATP-binding protein FtsE n=1 Tax=unclassified Aminobacterium TaxID=2685012 RepID=UPI001BCDCBC6|nr:MULTISPECIES: ATP-binding cassette domain-containing protein [unclassified Aminobacterium]MDD2206213.1 ATP-binding cassette domain-containing protein [Aminobacterium sp.]MDD3425833.1 ATP-binding cassette domain-containing protein [Aminobacterium sp.]MDD3707651.1 ATP-binding cassette domain-containing protein [Aminobacterium sp.]MDD4227943.1 ATP-binding cassette domain-containing protein [Aminobacterium sp.]MDD4551210.1 ATP-binding cassette domain-containing protein [Aminobacterium sp.]
MDIRLAGVTKIFQPDITALEDVYLDIKQGEFLYLVGTTGSGKTTLMRLITRELVQTRGQVTVGGRNLRKIRPSELPYYRRDIGVVFQDFKLLPNLTAWENVAFVLESMAMPPRMVEKRTNDVIDQVGLWRRRFLYPPQLSGGEQQRVAIARAMANSPSIFIADEPTGNLDVHTAEDIMRLLISLNTAGATVLMATHDQYLVDAYRQRVVELHEGRIVRDEEKGRYLIDGEL